MNSKIYRLLAEEGVDDDIVEGAHAFAKSNDVDPRFSDRIPEPEYFYSKNFKISSSKTSIFCPFNADVPSILSNTSISS